MTQSQLIKKITAMTGYKENAVEEIIILAMKEIKNSLIANEGVKIKYFGTFKVIKHKQRNGHHPHTHEQIVLKATKRVKFRPCDELKERVSNA